MYRHIIFFVIYAVINKERPKIKIYNSIPINKPVQSIKPSNKSRKILNFNSFMYKYEKDVLNIEKAKKFNTEINQKKKPIDTAISSTISNVNRDNSNNESFNDYSYLNNQAQLKSTCSSFINDNQPVNNNDFSNYRKYSIDYNSPEVLLQASYLNSLYALPHIFSNKIDEDDE